MQRKYNRPEKLPEFQRRWADSELTQAPVWCSVDLRDGNQALPLPMTIERKLGLFRLLCSIGFKQIEAGFPAASGEEYEFFRVLSGGENIPDDVTASMLSQLNERQISESLEAAKGLKRVILHLYLASSDLHRKAVFGLSKSELLKKAANGVRMARELVCKANMEKQVILEFSPEEFSDTDLNYSLEFCSAAREAWGESEKSGFILNLPCTVERRPAWQYADMVEYFIRHFPYISSSTVSIHTHNDRGCAIAAAEMALYAGAERVEGTLFGVGERAGNADLCALALNLQTTGVKTGLDFTDIPSAVRHYEMFTGANIHERQPYSGRSAFVSFSGSHQDAIRKGLLFQENKPVWKVPYMNIDPKDIGLSYDELVCINSQSGKGGALYVLEREFGIYPPRGMYDAIGAAVQKYAEAAGRMLTAAELIELFRNEFEQNHGALELINFKSEHYDDNEHNRQALVKVKMDIMFNGKNMSISANGNGPVSATVHALRDEAKIYDFVLEDFSEQTLGTNADACAMAFAGIRCKDKKLVYGAGEHFNIDRATVNALFSAINISIKRGGIL